MNDKSRFSSNISGIILIALFLIIILLLSFMLYGDDREDHYVYDGIDCYIYYDINRSLSNVSEIIDRYEFSSRIWYNRSSPVGSGIIVDIIQFSFNYSSSKNISGDIFNFDTHNLTIKLRYYPDDNSDRYKSYEGEIEARESTYSLYLEDKDKFETDVEYIISIFNQEFNSSPENVDYVQLIAYIVL